MCRPHVGRRGRGERAPAPSASARDRRPVLEPLEYIAALKWPSTTPQAYIGGVGRRRARQSGSPAFLGGFGQRLGLGRDRGEVLKAHRPPRSCRSVRTTRSDALRLSPSSCSTTRARAFAIVASISAGSGRWCVVHQPATSPRRTGHSRVEAGERPPKPLALAQDRDPRGPTGRPRATPARPGPGGRARPAPLLVVVGHVLRRGDGPQAASRPSAPSASASLTRRHPIGSAAA